ncbi:DNA helicase UvrD [Candidatus Aerophobetes bacterium]|nr:DNA helicase UvrD [Candidatus Aerophobetes bacterium]
MTFIADFHIHSRYSRATSKNMDIPNLDRAAQMKGINLLGTGDFTHPLWCAHLKKTLIPAHPGIFKYGRTHFILTCEVNNIFYKEGKVRKIHNIIFAPDFDIVEKINGKLERFGDLYSDGRPILKLEAKHLVELVMQIDARVFVVPSHIWTPWFSLFGSNSGFDSIEECFEDCSRYILAGETGLSSDPSMNWRLSSLDKIALISCSDAHSPEKIGREANIFNVEMGYRAILEAIKQKDPQKILYTIEFFPQEGKYHYDGHRNCDISLSPEETKKYNGICPVCKKAVTVGVLNRVEQLADRPEGFKPENAIPFKRIVPLREIVAEAIQKKPASKLVGETYTRIVNHYDGEMNVLLEVSLKDMHGFIPERVVEGIKRMREGKVKIKCGFDGVYGKVKIFDEEEEGEGKAEQLSLF